MKIAILKILLAHHCVSSSTIKRSSYSQKYLEIYGIWWKHLGNAVLVSLFIALFSQSALQAIYAADSLWLFTNNKQDVVVVGKVYFTDENYFYLDDVKVVSGEQDVEKSIKVVSNHYSFYNVNHIPEENWQKPTQYDLILASLKHIGDSYQVLNGLYMVDSLQIETLNILPTEDSQYFARDSAVLKCYTNSSGAINNFIFEENEIYYLNENGEKIVIYNDNYVNHEDYTSSEVILPSMSNNSLTLEKEPSTDRIEVIPVKYSPNDTTIISRNVDIGLFLVAIFAMSVLIVFFIYRIVIRKK